MEIFAYTDGSCLGNPGVGGYAAVMLAGKQKKVCCGYSTDVNETNNRMELRAVIHVVDWLNRVQKQPCRITIFTDSKYLVNCSKKQWSELTSSTRANYKLWIELLQKTASGKHELTYVKVKGHDDNEFNNEADKLARAQAIKARHIVFGR